MTRPQPRYKPGDKIGGRFEIHDINMGGMGEVYLCYDEETHSGVALKTFQQRYITNRLQQKFFDEVAVWIELGIHQNIVHYRLCVIHRK